MKHSTKPTVQPHMQKARLEFSRFLDEATKILSPNFVMQDGLVKIKLARPITFAEMRSLTYLFASDPELFRDKHDQRERNLQTKAGDKYQPLEVRNRVQFVSFLSETTKMGAYSFNLPAGPTGADSLGTCPVSAVGWPIDKYRKRVKVNELADDTTRSGDVPIDNWICASCYAMKGAYGSPGVMMQQEMRRRIVSELTKKPDDLKAWLVRAIRWGQVKSVLDRRSLVGKLDKSGSDRSLSVPDPGYFRIHDAGDFGFGHEYVDAWFETVRACSSELRVRVPTVKARIDDLDPTIIDRGGIEGGQELVLPPVKFWAATRAWCVASGLEQDARKGGHGVPENLTLRPSALYFGDETPKINGKRINLPVIEAVKARERKVTIDGYAPGTTAEFPDQAPTLGDWICPAYTPTDPTDPKSTPGACHKSLGPDAETNPNHRPSPEGHGCRACWDSTQWRVVYVRH